MASRPPSTLRVLHVTSGNLYGGIERMLVTLARQQASCPDMEPSFGVCFAGRLERELESNGAPVHRLGGVRLSRPHTVWMARRALRRLMSRTRFDAVVTHSAWAHVIFGRTVRRGARPLIRWLHAPAGTGWLDRWAARTRPDLAICNSRFTAAGASRLAARDVRIIHCPIEIGSLGGVSAENREVVRRELGVSGETCVIVQVGRMEAGKGHETHLRALARMRDRPSWICWFVGDAQRPAERAYVERLRALVTELSMESRVRFLGERTDVPEILAAADIYCQPGGAEGFGLTFVEAQMARLPVVTTATGAAPEIVDETCGVLVPPGDVEAVASALRGLIEDPRRRAILGAAGPPRAMALCDPGILLPRLRCAIGSVLGRAATGVAAAIATSSVEDLEC